MGLERTTRRGMVDRRKRRQIQNGKGKDRQSKCDLRGYRQGLGCRVQPSTWRYVGLPLWQTQDSRRPGIGEKPRGNIPLKLRRELDVRERGRPGLGGCFGTEEIKVAPDRDAASELDLKRLQPRVFHLYPSTILTV